MHGFRTQILTQSNEHYAPSHGSLLQRKWTGGLTSWLHTNSNLFVNYQSTPAVIIIIFSVEPLPSSQRLYFLSLLLHHKFPKNFNSKFKPQSNQTILDSSSRACFLRFSPMESPHLPPPPYQLPPPPASPTSPIPTPTPPSRKKPTISPSPLHLSNYITASVPLQELLSASPKRRPRSSRGLIQEEVHEPVVNLTPRKKRRGRAAAMVVAAASGFPGGCVASPRAGRRARRRLDKEVVVVREERDLRNGEEDGGVKVRKKRQCKSKKAAEIEEPREDLSLVPFVPPVKDVKNAQDTRGGCNDKEVLTMGLCDCLHELIMWKDVAKSTLWFGLGSIFFLSTSFSRDLNFSLISTFCHLGVFMLGMAFLRDCLPQRPELKATTRFHFTEEDILSVSRVVVPIANEVISKVQLLFSGDPSTTIKVLPVLLFGAKYGHLITFWRLCAAGFFLGFTLPKLYSSYSEKINRGVENVSLRLVEAWRNCPRKKFVAASAATMFWNLFSIKTRMMAAFVSIVILRYHYQQNKGEERHNKGHQHDKEEGKLNKGAEIKEDDKHDEVMAE